MTEYVDEKGFHGLYNDDLQITLLLITNGLSILGTLFIILINFASKFVFFMSISDLILSSSQWFILSPQVLDAKYKLDYMCQTQAFLRQFGQLSSIIWTLFIAIMVQKAVLQQKNLSEENFNIYLFVGFGVPCIVSLIPIFTQDYGYIGSPGCWIEFQRDTKVTDGALRTAEFYLPLCLIILYNYYVISRVIKFLNKIMKNNEQRKVVNKLKYYPYVLVTCRSVELLQKFYGYFYPTYIPLETVQYSLIGLQGFLNAFVFGYNDKVSSIIKFNFFPCWFKQKDQLCNVQLMKSNASTVGRLSISDISLE